MDSAVLRRVHSPKSRVRWSPRPHWDWAAWNLRLPRKFRESLPCSDMEWHGCELQHLRCHSPHVLIPPRAWQLRWPRGSRL